jgi:hypothetical protein
MLRDMNERFTLRRSLIRVALPACGIGALTLGAVVALAEPYRQEGRGPRPIVVELYTSQGCASCPPADQITAELTERDDVLPLTFPVDYWDYLGWHDTLARPQNAQRQIAYARRSQSGRVFTPQMVIDGFFSAIGSRRADVLARIAARQAAAIAAPSVPVRISVDGQEVSVSLPMDQARRARPGAKASVWLFPFGKVDMVHITGGENRGRSVRYSHVVRNIVMMGEWTGKAATFEHTLSEHDRGQFGYAVLIQDDGIGPVIAAAWAGDQGRMAPNLPKPEPPIRADPLLVNLPQ